MEINDALAEAMKEKISIAPAEQVLPTSDTNSPPVVEPPVKVDVPEIPHITDTIPVSLTDLFAKYAVITDTNPIPQISPDVQQKLAQAEEAIKTIEQLKSNPLFQAWQATLSPEKLREVIQEMIPEDHSKLDFKSLVSLDAKSLGLQESDLDDAVTKYIEKLDELTPYERAQAEKTLRDKYKPTSALKESEFLKNYTAELAKKQADLPKEPTEAEKQQLIEVTTKADMQSIDEVSKAFMGGDMYGVKFDQATLDAIKNTYNYKNVLPYLNESMDSFDSKTFVADAFYKINRDKLLQAAIDFGKAEARKEFSNPELNAGGGAPSNIVDGKTPQEKMAEFLVSQMQGKK